MTNQILPPPPLGAKKEARPMLEKLHIKSDHAHLIRIGLFVAGSVLTVLTTRGIIAPDIGHEFDKLAFFLLGSSVFQFSAKAKS